MKEMFKKAALHPVAVKILHALGLTNLSDREVRAYCDGYGRSPQ